MQVDEHRGSENRQASGLRLGPGLLVTAAFIGPGTVVTASAAGAERGCGLLWTILFSCFGTIVLQSLAARVGIVNRQGLGESIRETLKGTKWLRPAILVVISAVGVGNAAYQTGNLTGAAAGIQTITATGINTNLLVLIGVSASLILFGRYTVLQWILVGLVAILSTAFLCSACLSLPSADRIFSGLLIPRLRTQDLTMVIALIGTTIVPYNLFLHASSAVTTWKDKPLTHSIKQSNTDTLLSVSLGGLVTAAILITSSTAFFDTQTQIGTTGDIARQLEPTLGTVSTFAFSLGLFAAGLTSSITAPLATAYALCGCMGWNAHPSGIRFRIIALCVVLIGGVSALTYGSTPSTVIAFAQVANGLLLPIVAAFLLLVVSRNTSQKIHFGGIQLQLARLVVVLVGLLGIWRILSIF